MNASKEAILEALKNLQEDEEVCIRKLTPRELLRLMGVEDQWIDKMIASGLSKTSLSKLAGNSIVVDNLRYILKPLFVAKKAEVQHYEEGHQITLFEQIEDMAAKGEIDNRYA